MSKTIAVFGLGRFGRSLATSLYESGVDVLAVDKDHDIVETMSGKVTYAASADLTNPNAIKELGLGEMDVVVVAIGSDLKASIISVMVAKEEGVPYVIAKAADERMGEILKKKGGFRQRLMRKQAEYQKELSAEAANRKSKEQIKAEKEKKKKNEERAKKITV